MDIMRPELVHIAGQNYRINTIKIKEEDRLVEEDPPPDSTEHAVVDSSDEFDVEVLENGRYKSAFHVPRTYFPFIIGTKGNTKRRIENETNTQVKVPRQGQSGDIVIFGYDKKTVCTARHRIHHIVRSSRHKLPFTHFLSIPMTNLDILEGFTTFKDNVLNNYKSSGVDASIFQAPEKLHLTLATLILVDTEERENAVKLLQNCKEAVIEPILHDNTLKVRLAGLEIMNDDPREVDVLYGKVQTVGRQNILQDMVDSIIDYFINEGDLLDKRYCKVKLHVTLMNTLFRSDSCGVSETEISRHKQKPRESFDASEIMKEFKNYIFGEQVIDSIHISQRYSTCEDGYYKPTISLNLY